MTSGGGSQDDGTHSLVGKRLGKYQILRTIGQGGMGVVFEAEDTYLKRRVALKVLSPAITQDRTARQRFLREARAVASLNSPFIVAVYEVDQENNLIFLVMELFPGRSVQEHLSASGPFDWRTATLIAAATCRGLAAVHERGLVHRDIKPANIMLSSRAANDLASLQSELAADSVKLADFGLVKCATGEASPMTSASTVLGTAVFMSPEQCRAEPLDARSDIYSLGATYFALLTGQPPFTAEQPIQIMFAHCSAPVPDSCQLSAQIAPGCQAILERALAKEPSRRYQSASELREALLSLVGNSGVQTPSPPEPPPLSALHETRVSVTTAPAAKPVRVKQQRVAGRRLAVAAAIALFGVLLAGAIWVGGASLFNGNRSPTNRAADSKSPPKFALSPQKFPAGGPVQSLALDESGELLARGLSQAPGIVRVYNLRAGKDLPQALSGEAGGHYVRALAFVPGKRIIAAALESKVWLFEPLSGEKWQLVKLENAGVSWVATPSAAVLLLGESNWSEPASKIWKYELREEQGRLAAVNPRVVTTHTAAVKTLAVSPDAGYMASVDRDSQLRYGPLSGGSFESRSLPRSDPGTTDYSHGLAFSSDGQLLAAVADRRVVVWRLPNLIELKQFDVESHSTNIVLTYVPDSHVLVSASGSGVKFWNSETGVPVGKPINDHAGESISSLTFIPGREMLITGGGDKQISIRNWKEAAGISQP